MLKVGLSNLPERAFDIDHQLAKEAFLDLLSKDLLPYVRGVKPHRPTCFISYAWGVAQHEHWVKEFAEILEQAGFTVWLDHWEDRKGKILNNFIEKIEEADWVIVVGTKLYLEKYNKRAVSIQDKEHVVRLEAQLIEHLIGYNTKKGNKVVPVLLEGTAEESLPFMLRHKLPAQFTKNHYFEELLKLIQDLHGIDNQDKTFEGFFKKVRKFQNAISDNVGLEEKERFEERVTRQCLQDDEPILQRLQQHKSNLLEHSPKPEKNEPLVLSPRSKNYPNWNLPKPSGAFIRQAFLLDKLEELLHAEEEPISPLSTPLTAVACIGLKGIGKTQFVLHYIQKTEHPYTLRIWFSATSMEILQESYLQFAKAQGYSGDATFGNVLGYVKQWLSRNPGWLIIYDDASNAAKLQEFLPPSGGQVLITSCYQNWPKEVKRFSIPLLQKKEALELVTSILKKEAADIETLVESLGYLPEAIGQAGNYITDCKISPTEYLNLLQKYPKKTLESVARVKATSIATLWQGNFKAIEKECNQENYLLITALMLVSSYLAESISKEILLTWLQKIEIKAPEIELNTALRVLQCYSLIHIEEGGKTLSIHPLVKTVIRLHHQAGTLADIHIPHERLTKEWYDALLQVVHQYFESETTPLEDDLRKKSLLPHLECLVEHHESQWPEAPPSFHLSFLFLDVATVFLQQTLSLEKARALLKSALEVQSRYCKENSPIIAKTLRQLGKVYLLLGDIKKAKPLLKEALKIQEQSLGSNHLEVARTLIPLANLYLALNEPKKAKERLDWAFVILKKHFGEEHPEIAIGLGILAILVIDSDKRKAQDLLERALEIQKHYYGERHLAVAKALVNLGRAYKVWNELDKAHALLASALEIFKENYGVNHPYVHELEIDLQALEQHQKQKALSVDAENAEALQNGGGQAQALLQLQHQLSERQIAESEPTMKELLINRSAYAAPPPQQNPEDVCSCCCIL